MRVAGFVVGLMGVIASVFVAILVRMVGDVIGQTGSLSLVGPWVAAGLGVVALVLIWRYVFFAEIGFFLAAVVVVASATYVAIVPAIFLVVAGGFALFYGRSLRNLDENRSV